jgi:MFS transporter, PPP family, 3-phenylpropionic acid transporter
LIHSLYWRLSRFYFFYYFFVGLFVPYWGLYLQSKNFTAFQIGILLSLFQISRIFAPNFWGWLADHTNKRARWIRLASFIGCLGYIGVFWADSFFLIFLVMMSMSLFTSSTIPLAESLTLSHLAATNGSYSNIRLWGSVGFIIASFFLGILIDRYSVTILIWALLFTQLIILCLSFSIPDKKFELIGNAKRSIFKILKKPEVISLLIGCALMVSSHGLLYNFYSIFLKEQGYSSSLIGILWSIGVIFEIFIFILMPKILSQFHLKEVLLISLFLAVIRFFLIGNYVDILWILILAQILHAATFGSFHVASVELVSIHFHREHHSRGQSIYNSITYGLGGTVGGLGGGFMIDQYGAANTFMFSSILPLIAFIVIFFGLKNTIKRSKNIYN